MYMVMGKTGVIMNRNRLPVVSGAAGREMSGECYKVSVHSKTKKILWLINGRFTHPWFQACRSLSSKSEFRCHRWPTQNNRSQTGPVKAIIISIK